MKRTMIREVKIPEGVHVSYENKLFTAKGAKGEVSKTIFSPIVQIEIKDGKVVVSAENVSKNGKTIFGTCVAHINNVIKGSNEGFVYKLKICSGHFPMNVSVSGNKFIVKNYLGEKVPRILILKAGPVVKVDGQIVTVTGCDKELTGQAAADIEQLMRITNRDRRIFQDGIFITEKHGKVI